MTIEDSEKLKKSIQRRQLFETWFKQQYFYNQLRFILGDRIFDFDQDIGYRNLHVQVGYVAFFREDMEFVL